MSVVERNVPPADLLERIRETEKELEALRAGLAAWEGAYERTGARDVSFTTISGVPVEPLYTPLDRPEPGAEEAAPIVLTPSPGTPRRTRRPTGRSPCA